MFTAGGSPSLDLAAAASLAAFGWLTRKESEAGLMVVWLWSAAFFMTALYGLLSA